MINTKVIDASKRGYYVDDKGNVIGKKGEFLSKKPITKSGYHYFSFRLFGKRTKIMTHQLKAYQKFGNKVFNKDIQVTRPDSGLANGHK